MTTSSSSSPRARTVSAEAETVGRYAPSPSGDLHLGNLRTALFAWLFARSAGGVLKMRVEDLDRVREGAAESQLRDLAALGIDWEPEVLYQSTRTAAYEEALSQLQEKSLVYECFCTRREIQAASSAPHGAPGAYPGTCRNLTEEERAEKRTQRNPALRLKSEVATYTVLDRFAGEYTAEVDDFVLRRTDGVFAYNLAVVVDDHFQGVTQVVRGDDLLPSAPRQAYLANLLGWEAPRYVHVPLALNKDGARLAKRDGAVTLAQLLAAGLSREDVVRMISASIPLAPVKTNDDFHLPENAAEMLTVFSPENISLNPWTVLDPLMEGTCCIG
ncbi:tRNA glutamyl-Q(34) synthetase GluQRS [Rothia aerolata]|uniref:Glutamyl-Q tRNA(Asp) synthetase n=1 Tax=Rothia aerolata TaxID=1812262 RepID=A0A917IT30_9MICC|nr:glutamyl-Q tRNA(Asp) synthetase [Rothia aerolata]